MLPIPDAPEIRNPEAAADAYYYGCYDFDNRCSGLLTDDEDDENFEEDIEND